jgi:hypothetical protein
MAGITWHAGALSVSTDAKGNTVIEVPVLGAAEPVATLRAILSPARHLTVVWAAAPGAAAPGAAPLTGFQAWSTG